MTPRDRLSAIFAAAIRAVDAGAAVARALPHALAGAGQSSEEDEPPVVVIALGKAACAMAVPVEAALAGRIRGGIVVTKDGHDLTRGGTGGPKGEGCRPALALPVRETAHPVPDARCERAARETLAIAASAPADAILLVLLSGGASSLTACPAAGLDLDDVAATTRALLGCGADIQQMNCVRKHLSDFAGGRLARAATARRIEVLAVSDVAGDSLDVIGSGPCAPDPTTFADALAVIDGYALRDRLPARVVAHLEAGLAGTVPETPKPADPLFARVRHTVVAANADARAAAADEARRRGLEPVSLGECLRGEARERGAELVARVRVERGDARRCFIAGGETTVTLTTSPGREVHGKGGRSQELALSAALALAGCDDDIGLLAAGSDGSDGPTDAAGAFVDGGTVARAAAQGLDAEAALRDHDAYPFFAREGGLVVTGPTGTNVMDLVLVEA